MNLLRTFLLMLLVCAVPTTSLAATAHQARCIDGAPGAASARADDGAHAGHAMPMHHAAADAAVAEDPPAMDSCACGCDCSATAHCGSGGVASADRPPPVTAFDGVALRVPAMRAGQARPGFARDTLRPPSRS